MEYLLSLCIGKREWMLGFTILCHLPCLLNHCLIYLVYMQAHEIKSQQVQISKMSKNLCK